MRRIFMVLILTGVLVLPVRAETPAPCVALTFDDGPSGHYTERLLDGLQKRHVPATFLLCGYRMQQYPELTQRIFDEGHEIGLHGFSHKNLGDMSRREIAFELMRSEQLLPHGCRPAFLRPPGGSIGDGVRQVSEARQLALLTWSVDPRDWAVHDAPLVRQRVLEAVKDGDVILLHDMSESSVTAALEIIDRLQQQGFRFVTVSRLAELRGVRLRPGQVYRCFPQQLSQSCA